MHSKRPLVSVVTVHSGGRRLLADLLPALLNQTYQPIEILVVDNASTDGSAAWVRERFAQVRLVTSPANLGFCGGNNLGIHAASGRFVVLINNDTVPERDWLEHLVAEAETEPSIGAVASKILFLRPFVPVSFTSETFNPAAEGLSSDSRDLGFLFDTASEFVGSDYKKSIFTNGFLGPEQVGGRSARWSTGQATVLLPVRDRANAATLRLVVSSGGVGPQREISVHVGTEKRASFVLSPDFEHHDIEVSDRIIQKESFDVINNAGSRLSASGVAGDRGIYEPDRGQYDIAEDVEAVCGASVLFRRRALEDVGVFDPDFFMYYEDTDLSWRLRRHGYRLRYQPRSVVRHIHAATSVAWSPMFNFYVARNRVLMITKNGSLRDFLQAYTAELKVTFRLLRCQLRRSGNRPEGSWQQLITRLRVQRSFLKQIPRAILRRWNLLPH